MFFLAACGFCVVFLQCQTNEKNKIMKKAILIVSIFLVAWCFFAVATTVPVTVAEITAVCIFELVLLSLPVIAITIITNIEY